MKNQRDFKGVWVPREIWLTDELTLTEKVFFVEIDSLDNENGCFAGNQHFADFFKLSKGRCSQIINSLVAKGFITIDLQRNESKQIIKRVLKVNRGYTQKLKGVCAKTKQGYLENDEGSNTRDSNTIYKNNVENNVKARDGLDYQQIENWYHEFCPELPTLRIMSESRKRTLKAWGNMDEIKEAFEVAGKSDFLNGKKTDFKAGFDWIIKPANRVKILEGFYNNHKAKGAATDYSAMSEEKKPDWVKKMESEYI